MPNNTFFNRTTHTTNINTTQVKSYKYRGFGRHIVWITNKREVLFSLHILTDNAFSVLEKLYDRSFIVAGCSEHQRKTYAFTSDTARFGGLLLKFVQYRKKCPMCYDNNLVISIAIQKDSAANQKYLSM